VPRKTARSRATRRPEPEVVADGALAHAIDRAFENPAMSGGLAVMAVTAMAIMSNAMFLQHGQHPEPLFATRPAPAVHVPRTVEPSVPLPRSRGESPAATLPPVPKAEPAPQPPPVAAAPAPQSAASQAAAAQAALTTSIQRELARLGLYTGAIDGMPGPQTRAAISDWQNAAGIKVTGEPTTQLLAALQKPTASITPAAPVGPVASVATDQVAAAVARAAELEREQAALENADELRRVQVALSQIGYGPLTIDGMPDDATANALRRFQLDNGLPVTGELGDKVTQRLVAIGAMRPD
jgi:peptidoglycan hydrolase-like protein with peptidoglycan-binding domain